MKHLLRLSLLVILAFSLAQCSKDPGYIGGPDNPPVAYTPDPEPIVAGLKGNITDEQDLPAANVQVTIGTQTTTTDAKGFFKFSNASLDKRNTMVVAQKSGYFKGIRLFSATAGTNYVSIKLIKKVLAGTVSAASGGSINLPNSSIIALPANGVVVAASSAAYTGTINVYAQYIDPSAADISKTIPGSLAGISADGKNVLLTSYAMMAVELESAAGEKLQLKEGSEATLVFAVPAVAQSSAPASIPLWYVDEKIGLWREEGTATKQGNQYTGKVKHFSFWNCDFSTTGVTLSMTLLNSNNAPLVNTAVRLTRPNITWLTTITGYTDSLGNVSGIVPSNETLQMEVLDPCGAVLYSQTINPITQNTNLGNITVTNTGAGIVTVRGRLVDCNSAPISNGYAMIEFNNNVRYATVDANGIYQTTFTFCPGTGSSATILAIDNGTGGGPQRSATVNVNLTSPTSNLGDIVVCEATPFAYINYNIDGVDYYWNQQNSFQMQGVNFPGSFTLLADNQPSPRQFVLNVNGNGTGTFDATFTSTDAFMSGGGVFILPGFTSTVVEYALVWPEFYVGSFSGQFTHSSTGSVIHTINGTYRVIHQF